MAAAMSWPNAAHFAVMMQDPEMAFRDPRLKKVLIEKDPIHKNQPRVWSGKFANVYRATDPATRESIAIRVFTSGRRERQDRYNAVAEYLKKRQLDSLVHFHYQHDGVRSASDGKWYPLVVMDWVAGETLYEWVRAKCLKRDRRALSQVSGLWVKAVAELNHARIAHGDLQHGNVMVVENGRLSLKFVDYDCMCVPALVGRKNLEIGVAPYQHPQRNGDTLLGPDLDNFSALFILVALRALAAAPELWDLYVEKDQYDNLLFRCEDLENPDRSSLVQRLRKLRDGQIPDFPILCDRLLELAHEAIDKVPPLHHVLLSWDEVESLVRARKHVEAFRLLAQAGMKIDDAPRRLQPLLRDAKKSLERDRALSELQQVPRTVNEDCDRRLVKAWNEPLFAGWDPAEGERPRVIAATERLKLVEQIHREISKAPSPEGEERIANWAATLSPAYFTELRPRIQQAGEWVRLFKGLERALQEPASDLAIWSQWKKLGKAKAQRIVPRRYHPRISQAGKRVPVLTALRAIPPKYPPKQAHQFDPALLETCNDDLLRDCVDAAPWREAYESAVERKAALDRLDAAIASTDNQEIVRLAGQPCLKGYVLPPEWEKAVGRARTDVLASQELEAGLKNDDRSRFHEVFDVRIIRRNAAAFRAYQERLGEWIPAEILPLNRIGLAPPVGRQPVVDDDAVSEPSYRVCWKWPDARFSERCLVGVCNRRPPRKANLDPYALAEVYAPRSIDRKEYEKGGGSVRLIPEQERPRGYVVVWAAVELGFAEFYSEPLVLGRLDLTDRR